MTNPNFKGLQVGRYYVLSSIDLKKCSITQVGLFTANGFTSITPYFSNEHVVFDIGTEVNVNVSIGYSGKAVINGITYA